MGFNGNRLIINPSKLQNYIISMQKHCKEIQDSQTAIESNFKLLGNSWDDKIYDLTNNILYDTAKSVGRIYEELRKSIVNATEQYNEYISIQEYPGQHTIAGKNISEFLTQLRGKEVGNKFYENNNTNLDDMQKYILAMQKYIEDTEKIVKNIRNEHEQIGREGAWVAPQYYQLGNVLNEVEKSIARQMSCLRDANELTRRKYERLRQLLDGNI